MQANALRIAPLGAVHIRARGYQHEKSIVFSFVEGRIRNACNWF